MFVSFYDTIKNSICSVAGGNAKYIDIVCRLKKSHFLFDFFNNFFSVDSGRTIYFDLENIPKKKKMSNSNESNIEIAMEEHHTRLIRRCQELNRRKEIRLQQVHIR